jgi:hypothetical protein
MKGVEFVINFEEDKAFITKDKVFAISELGILSIKQFKAPANWRVRVINYIPEERRIFAEIISYNIGKSTFINHHLEISGAIDKFDKISFKYIDTNGLICTASGHQHPLYYPIPEQNDIERIIESKPPPLGDYWHPPIYKGNQYFTKDEPIERKIKTSFSIPIKILRFQFGAISFEKRIAEIGKTVEFTVYNEEIREEFDAIKNYFENVLKSKKINVNAEILLVNNEVTSIEATSEEISKINKNIIELVKFEFVRSFKKKKIQIEIDKSIFTMDEFINTLSEKKVDPNIFFKTEKDLFEDMLKISSTKHYHQLRYLSSKHEYTIMKLRFIIKPISFIFLISGELNHYLIWETLDTEEATYVWQVEKDKNKLKMKVKEIENILNVIKTEGRTAYINSDIDHFRRIYHDYSNIKEGFKTWKDELDITLT